MTAFCCLGENNVYKSAPVTAATADRRSQWGRGVDWWSRVSNVLSKTVVKLIRFRNHGWRKMTDQAVKNPAPTKDGVKERGAVCRISAPFLWLAVKQCVESVYHSFDLLSGSVLN